MTCSQIWLKSSWPTHPPHKFGGKKKRKSCGYKCVFLPYKSRALGGVGGKVNKSGPKKKKKNPSLGNLALRFFSVVFCRLRFLAERERESEQAQARWQSAFWKLRCCERRESKATKFLVTLYHHLHPHHYCFIFLADLLLLLRFLDLKVVFSVNVELESGEAERKIRSSRA